MAGFATGDAKYFVDAYLSIMSKVVFASSAAYTFSRRGAIWSWLIQINGNQAAHKYKTEQTFFAVTLP